MNYVFVAIGAYIFMRAFETVFADEKEKPWCKRALRVIGLVVLYVAASSIVVWYAPPVWLLGFDPKM